MSQILEIKSKSIEDAITNALEQLSVSREDIESIYGSPMEVIQDLIKACEMLDLGINTTKYDDINDIIIELLSKYVIYRGDEKLER